MSQAPCHPKKRIIAVAALFAVILFLYGVRLYQLQIVDGAEYLKLSQNRVGRLSSVKAPRGEIADRFGRPLVVNRGEMLLMIEKTSLKGPELNDMLLRLAEVFLNTSDSYIDLLPLSTSQPYEFTPSADTTRTLESQVSQAAKLFGLAEDCSAAELAGAAVRAYELEDYAPEKARLIAGIRYSMAVNGFGSSTPYVFARGVGSKTITVISEESALYPGVLFDSEPVREYVTPGLASHILGYLGPLTSDEYRAKKSEGYAYNDTIGKEGIELSMEKYLRGFDGTRLVERNIDGAITEISIVKEPVAGNSVYLTIDKNLQAVAEESLENMVKELIRLAPARRNRGKDASAAAVVAVDVKTGEILALGSYPTFDLTTFRKNYNALIEDPKKPTRNRATCERYAPGSTFKLITGLACLQENVLTASTRYTCRGKYTYFSSYQPTCYTATAHGTLTVASAITKSCNVFFFDAGRRLGIDKLAKYTAAFGLNEKTGIQIDEVASRTASAERRQRAGRVWNPGDTIQAAIGQSDHEFTIVGMAGYIATVANKGVRPQLSLVKSVKNAGTQETLYEFTPAVKAKVDIDERHFDTVISGMRRTTTVAASYMGKSNYPIEIAFKTGTAQTGKGKSDNALMVGFAPSDDPQIAFAAVVEGGGLGEYLTPIAKDIVSAYFAAQQSQDRVVFDGEFVY